jgi:hypothetical protein
MMHPDAHVPLCQNQQALFLAVLESDKAKVTCKTCLRILNAEENK